MTIPTIANYCIILHSYQQYVRVPIIKYFVHIKNPQNSHATTKLLSHINNLPYFKRNKTLQIQLKYPVFPSPVLFFHFFFLRVNYYSEFGVYLCHDSI